MNIQQTLNERIAALRREFQTLDVNSDGRITQDEFIFALDRRNVG